MTRLIYDGSFEGLLTAIFEVHEYKFRDLEIVAEAFPDENLFAEKHQVFTDVAKAKRIEAFVEKYSGSEGVRNLLRVFLSENENRERLIFFSVNYLIQEKVDIFSNYANEQIVEISNIVKSVGRETHRMKAFVRFRKLADDSYFAHIEPDFNVLPLIINHFKNRYSDQRWMIYDLRRNYGIYYDLNNVEFFFPTSEMRERLLKPSEFLHEEEFAFENLWRNYFRSTNIRERKNPKLHLQHLPKRYWKYLTEKQ
ncbi:TIGR03915 family putative DNA repair protein [Cruoricaptor ignavus]|uniref:TIGR03915 family putative DNA repair protein n=1 Tax=Cruoricaptor ignavus TaxID=1118202 RepID=A0A7M1T394_9FLAO|nr:TIGR03915 family putative DNA repair protein [Cruoricaptor ignavus]QOR74295.1 TIGR03915 family putative DNA repair protein [Cruoricaptor ignavus]